MSSNGESRSEMNKDSRRMLQLLSLLFPQKNDLPLNKVKVHLYMSADVVLLCPFAHTS